MTSQPKSRTVHVGFRKRIVRVAKGALSGTVFLGLRVLFGLKADRKRYSLVIPEATYSPWLADEAFQSALTDIAGRTMIGEYKLFELWQLAAEASKQQSGDVLEIGVWRGGSGCLMARRLQQCGSTARVFLCDTFEGVVKAGEHDPSYRGGEHSDTSAEEVGEFARDLGLENVTVLQGVFPEDTGPEVGDRRFALCHIDVDVYDSASDCLDWVWERMLPGGLVVFDDYGNLSTAGVTRLVDEQRDRPDRHTIHNLNGHAIVIKRAPTPPS